MPEKSPLPEFEILEFQRLSTEILSDRKLQFNLFWQSITVTSIILSLCVSIFNTDIWLKFPFFILAPHLILMPTSTIILNRARTANRKSGYLLAAYNKYSSSFNWERDLSILRQTGFSNGDKFFVPPHRTGTIRSMLLTISILEIICILIFIFFLFAKPIQINDIFWIATLIIGFLYTVAYSLVISSRSRAYFCTRYEESIQGYATKWTNILNLDTDSIDKIGKWDDKTWAKLLNDELNKYLLKYLWKIIWSQRTRSDKTWDLKPSYIKPIILGSFIWILIAIIIMSLNIDMSDFSKNI